ncbi:MAG: hypothetical protein JSS76_10825 [Bacteroidetes bacterium]|nr:hypothetical protein [Bacteroidota bacterium]
MQSTLNGNTNYFEFTVECPVKSCDITGTLKDTLYLIAPVHSKFVLIDMTADKCVIRFDIFSKSKYLRKALNYESEDYMAYKYFLITKAQLDFKTRQIFKKSIAFSMGTAVIPIKFRTGPFDFTKDVTIGTTFGAKILLNSYKNISFDVLAGLGVSSNTLDSLNTSGKVMQPTDIFAFSPTAGVMLEIGSAQIGMFAGYDFPSQYVTDVYNWRYANKPWFSVALGYSIFTTGIKKF